MVWDSNAASPGLQIDAYVSLDKLSLELVSELEQLAPFGPGNLPVQLATCDLRIVEDTAIGRDGEHRRLVVADERGTQQTVLWWQGAGEMLPEGRFDLAYALRARDYRGDMQLQVEWVESRPHSSSALSPSRPGRTIVDLRREAEPRMALARLDEKAMVVWAEAEAPGISEEIGGTDRLNLTSSPALVIWTAPPGPVELAQAIQAVNPVTVYLFAVEPATAGFRPFLERMAGMVKHDLLTRGGRMNIRRVAAALGHREATIRVGLEWLVARGQLQVIEMDEDSLTLQAEGKSELNWQVVENRLRRSLDETAAYRRHFRSAPAETLGISA
jgi:single-stranded-DNA-specific exonuclease